MTSKKLKMHYDYHKRTKGGFLDVIFLSSMMVTALALILLAISGGR